jgi:hypothetical protein
MTRPPAAAMAEIDEMVIVLAIELARPNRPLSDPEAADYARLREEILRRVREYPGLEAAWRGTLELCAACQRERDDLKALCAEAVKLFDLGSIAERYDELALGEVNAVTATLYRRRSQELLAEGEALINRLTAATAAKGAKEAPDSSYGTPEGAALSGGDASGLPEATGESASKSNTGGT